MSLKNRSFLKLLDYTPAEIEELLDLAADLKAKKKAGIRHNEQLAGKNIALIFEKTSTRTRCSFEVAAHDLGMEVTYLDPSGSQIGKKESIADTARVLGRMFDGIEYRGYGQEIVEDLAHYAGVPVWNGLTNEFHPTQILADFLTIREHFGSLKGIHFVYFGDARYNMGNSLMVGCAKMGLHFTACAPKKYQPDAALIAQCQAIAAETGATLTFEEDPAKAAQGADVLYTDVWVSMGEPIEVWAERIHDLAPYQINQELMNIAGPKAVFMHCLPAYHDHMHRPGRFRTIGLFVSVSRFGLPETPPQRVLAARENFPFSESVAITVENPLQNPYTKRAMHWKRRETMGGGHLSRPDFGIPQPDPDHPLTEFYLLLQHGLDKAGVFHLPALYASFRAPARRIYADEAAGYLTLSETADEGAVLLSAPRNLQLLYSSLHVEPDGSPAALLLTEECSRAVCAVQLLPPFVWEDPLPPLPDVPAALTLQLTLQDVEAIDTDPAALARRLCQTTRQKHWLAHPKADLYLAEKIALFQRLYR